MSIPTKLKPVLYSICKDPSFQNQINDFNQGVIQWKDPSLIPVKIEIRKCLRKHQDERCYFCRRPIIAERRNMYEDIEHFLDKSKTEYRRWGIHPLNLTLSCKACNFEKSTKDLGAKDVKAAKKHPPRSGTYRWLHPYFDDYDQNIKFERGPIYSPIAGAKKHLQATLLIKELKLDDLKEIEKRKNEALDKIIRINEIVSKLISSGKRKTLQQKLMDYQKKCIIEGFI
ncbi:MAG: hypothetical protein JJ871_19540 [Thalassospira sp.]|uniref:hypothetical protein n=1 Tax=Thalassospira sp. TaxID=1912094 RepID=UPI001B2D211B|nr:hypothetical protein [Thalassospira sp.]MBO6577903.1 hypothetical protein [Thalassospira sp.]MBO6817205.1 hypothetical protein [Thalassospira sp.]MBO6890234.1 hypothetical protein [Thalassospira sp.]